MAYTRRDGLAVREPAAQCPVELNQTRLSTGIHDIHDGLGGIASSSPVWESDGFDSRPSKTADLYKLILYRYTITDRMD